MKLLRGLIVLGCLVSPLVFSCELEDISYSVFQNSSYIDFKQTKKIKALSRPLVSTGKIWLSPSDELVWQTLVPIKSTLVISANGLRQYNKNDVLQSELNAPIALDLANIFLDILKGDFTALQDSFSSTLICDNEDWILQLAPLSARFGSFLKSISIDGSDTLRVINFQEERGDTTDIQLSGPRLDPEINFEAYLEG